MDTALAERQRDVLAMREAGASYAAIAAHFGFSKARAEQIVMKAGYRRLMSRFGLSTRAFNVLRNANVISGVRENVSQAELIERIRQRGIESLAAEYNCGAKTLLEFRHYAGIWERFGQ